MSIYQEWIKAKAAETEAIQLRRELEDEMLLSLGVEGGREGSKTFKPEGFKVKVTQRMNRSVDGDLLQEIAAEHGLSEHLGALFRWKPDINAKAWKDADESITAPLLAAITTRPGRPSFSIEPEAK